MDNVQPTLDVGNRLSLEGPTVSRREFHEFGELLKRHREQSAMTQEQAAQRVDVSRATFAQWETGRHLPGEQRVHDLDRLLGAGGDLASAVELARRGHRSRVVDATEQSVAGRQRSLLGLLRDTRRAFLSQLSVDEEERPIGWRHNLVPSNELPSTLSTAYGLKVLALLDGPDDRTPAVVNTVMDRAVRVGGRIVGWAARSQAEPRLETTAPALDGLLYAGVPFSREEVERIVRDLLDDTARQRPFILATALEPVLRVAPDSDLAKQLVKALLDSRREFGGVLLWPEKRLPRDQPLLEPSVAHTARAVTVLRNAPDDTVGDAVEPAEQWLTQTDNLDGVSEIIRRTVEGGGREEFPIDHFTSAWVVRALAGASAPDHRRIHNALTHVWARYDPDYHFWAWGNGDMPVWMLADAIGAVKEAALALYQTPAGANPGPR